MIIFFMFELKCQYRQAQLPCEVRQAGYIPAIIYGGGTPGVKVKVNLQEYTKFSKTPNIYRIFPLVCADKTFHVILQAMQRNTKSNVIESMDFIDTNLTQKFKIWVPVITEGKPIGVQQGGLLRIIHSYLPLVVTKESVNSITEIKLDISNLKMNQKISTSQLVLPEGVTLYAPKKYVQILQVVTSSKA